MATLYYEQCIDSPKIPTKQLIKLSELRRKFDKNTDVQNTSEYLNKLKDICKTLRYRRIQLKQHPQFSLGKLKSTNWTVELLRVSSAYKDLLIEKANKEEDLKEKNKILLEAMRLCNSCSQYSTSMVYDHEENRLFKDVNPQFYLAQTFSLAADRFYNMYKYRTNAIAIKKAFQFKELSYLLWKHESNIVDVIKYKATALLEMARKIEDDECGQKVALLQSIVTNEVCPEDVKAQYEVWKQQNDTVYYKPVVTDKNLDVISLEDAFRTLAKCFEGPST